MDRLPPARRSQNMAAIRSKDMKPELTVRKTLHRLGFRYRLHQKSLPGKPDIVLVSKKKVIFVNGCFWHSHLSAQCPDGRIPKSNLEYWEPKLRGNVERDCRNQAALQAAGWQVLVIWECETKNIDALRRRLLEFLA